MFRHPQRLLYKVVQTYRLLTPSRTLSSQTRDEDFGPNMNIASLTRDQILGPNVNMTSRARGLLLPVICLACVDVYRLGASFVELNSTGRG